ncbi:MAG TPA: hypothetical protein VN372_13180 [Methanospirillum sp.]|nr:hypothetical protein [Methanospirillum sp.]
MATSEEGARGPAKGPVESPKEKETKFYSDCTSGAGGGEGMKQPDPAGVCACDYDCGCSSAETRGVIPPPRPPTEDSERIVPMLPVICRI